MSDNVAQGQAAAPAASSTSVVRIGLIAIPLAAIVIGIGAYYLVFEGKYNPFAPSLYEVSGKVYWNGELAKGGEITTLSPTGQQAIGWIEEDGSFSMRMQREGRWAEGIPGGEHKVRIAAYDGQKDNMGEFSNMSPESYSSFETSGLTLSVNGTISDWKIELKGEGRTPPRQGIPNGAGTNEQAERNAGLNEDRGGDDGELSPPPPGVNEDGSAAPGPRGGGRGGRGGAGRPQRPTEEGSGEGATGEAENAGDKSGEKPAEDKPADEKPTEDN